MPDNEVKKLIPEIRGKIDARAEQELNLAFRRIYDYIEAQLITQKNEINSIIRQQLENKIADLNSLIGIFSQPLAGSNVSDPLLQSVLQTFGVQDANKFFAGPTPSFRTIT